MALVLLGACGGDSPEAQPFRVVIGSGAAKASDDAGVDLQDLVSRSAARVLALLPHRGRVQIEVQLDETATAVIPEIGVGGITDGNGNVRVWIEERPPQGLRKALETWIPATVAHELHHSSRVRVGPGYGGTLGEALVSEGLADRFMEEAFPATPAAPWDQAIPKQRVRDLWRRARPILSKTWSVGGYDHRAWFFGGGDLPRWGGYTLAYRIAGAYLGENRKPSGSVVVPAVKVIAAYRRANPL